MMPTERLGRIRVLVVDSKPVVRDGVEAILRRQRDIIVVAFAGDGRAAVEQFQAHRPDVTLTGLRLSGMDGFQTISEILKVDRLARILVFKLDETAAAAAVA